MGLYGVVPSTRLAALDRLDQARFDVVIVGAGINGAACAAALAGRGARVALIDRGDFGGFTSQESSNMVWGGIKYLQSYEFGLVWSLCRARNKLMDAYPTRIREIPFVAAVGPTAPFSTPLAAIGTGVYWLLGGLRTSSPRVYSAASARKLEPMLAGDGLRGAVSYRDGILVDHDARFVWDFVCGAIDHGVVAVNYMEATDAEWGESGWRLGLRDTRTGQVREVVTRVLVNAAGPFATDLDDRLGVELESRLVLSKGIHLVVPRLGGGDRALAFFDDDGRLFYVLPLRDRSVIGTTDTRVTDPNTRVEPEDRAFILDQVNRRLDLERPIRPEDVIAERSGVRPLVVSEGDDETNDWMALSRRHRIEVEPGRRVVTLLGGKLTDCINVGEKVADAVAGLGVALAPARRWFGEDDPHRIADVAAIASGVAWGGESQRTRAVNALWRRQGHRALEIARAWDLDPESARFAAGSDFTMAELEVIARDEMVVMPEDLLRRRTTLALTRSEAELEADPGVDRILGRITG